MKTSFKHKIRLIWQFIRISLISGVIFITALVITLGVLTWVNRDSIKKAFIDELNKNLKSEVYIDRVGVNLFRSFPLASVTLYNVSVLEAVEKENKDTLLNARRVYFQFSIIDLLRKDYNVRQLEVSKADFNPVIFHDGKTNYIIWESPDDDTDKEFQFDFERIILRNVNVSFKDFSTNTLLDFRADRSALTGQFSHNDYALSIYGDFFAERININNTEFVASQSTKLDVVLDVFENQYFVFEKGNIIINAHEFDVTGKIDSRREHTFFDLDINSKKLTLQNLVRDLPQFVKAYLDGYRVNGNINFNATINGYFSDKVNPYIQAGFNVMNAELFDEEHNVFMKNLNFRGQYNNGRLRNLASSSITLTNFSSRLNNGFLEGNVYVLNFNRPNVKLDLNSNILLSDIVHFLKIDRIKNARGQLELDLNFDGIISDGKSLRPEDILASTTRGNINFSNLSFFMDDSRHFENLSGYFMFNNNDIVVENLNGSVESSDFYVNGYFRNFLSYLFFDEQKLYADANFKSDYLNFSELLQHDVSGLDTTYRLSFSERANFRLNAEVGHMVFQNFEAFDVNGRALMRDKVFMAESINLSTMDGAIDFTGTIDGKNTDLLKVNCMATSNNIDIQQLFYQMNNFGQEAIVDKHLKGSLNSTVHFSANWSPYLKIDMNSIIADADVVVENGELINYDPVLALSRFLRIGDLKHINFSTLENQISIKDQTVYIPFMEINSSAIDIKLSGEHKFNNEIDYRLQVKLSDLLAHRSRESRNPQEQYGEIIDDGNTRTLYLLVTGTIDDPTFRYDTRAVRERIREDLRQERVVLRDVLREEFTRATDTIDDFSTEEEKKRIKERQDIKKQEDGDFIIEWE